MGWRTLLEVREGSGSLGEIRDGSGDPPEGPGRVEYTMGSPGCLRGPLGRSGTGPKILGEIRDGSGNLG